MAVASGTPTSTPASTDGKEVAVVSAAGGARAAVVSRVEKTAATDANMLTYVPSQFQFVWLLLNTSEESWIFFYKYE